MTAGPDQGGARPPHCPTCGERVGVYEPLWRIAPDGSAERTSWLTLSPSARHGAADTLWHLACAEDEGVAGG